jgi:hypothetical protein
MEKEKCSPSITKLALQISAFVVRMIISLDGKMNHVHAAYVERTRFFTVSNLLLS